MRPLPLLSPSSSPSPPSSSSSSSSSSVQTAARVKELAEKFLSQRLIEQEIADVQVNKQEHEYLTIRTRPKAGEIVAFYERDAMKMELVISLPPAYPIDVVSVCTRKKKRNREWRRKTKKKKKKGALALCLSVSLCLSLSLSLSLASLCFRLSFSLSFFFLSFFFFRYG